MILLILDKQYSTIYFTMQDTIFFYLLDFILIQLSKHNREFLQLDLIYVLDKSSAVIFKLNLL